MSYSASSKEKANEGNISVPIEIQMTKKVDSGSGIRNKMIVMNGMTSGMLEDML